MAVKGKTEKEVVFEATFENPLAVVEEVAKTQEWNFTRDSEHEITFVIEGEKSEYHASFLWLPDIEALHVSCTFDFTLPKRRRSAVNELLSLINEHLWIGHFCAWEKSGLVMFRQTLLLSSAQMTEDQCASLMLVAIKACESYYEVFNLTVSGGRTPQDALQIGMLETRGNA